ncbi:hypothetical protein KWG64_01780 [Rahnella sp. PD12R]|nr:hypothetical protein [Rahnella sp. PD12R]
MLYLKGCYHNPLRRWVL